MQKITLYTTLGCHLCEQAEKMVNHLIDNKLANCRLSSVEISDHDGLVDRYGIRIPVLAIGDSELGWPFDITELQSWINQPGR